MKLKSQTLVNLSMALLLSFSIAYFTSSVIDFYIEPCLRISFKSPRNRPELNQVDYRLEREGFFQSKEKKERRIKAEKRVITTFKSYTLKGTVVCSKCGHSIAILKENSGKTVIVSEGEEISGYRVKKVFPEEVVLERGKEELILTLKGKEEQEGKRFSVRREEIADQISSGLFLKYINIVPTKEPQGLKVTYVNPKSFIYKLGIRPGDIILSINEIRIRTPEDSFAAFEKLKSTDSITITVLRKGKKVKLQYEIE